MGKLGSSSLEPGAYLLRAQNQARAFEPEPRLVPPLVRVAQTVHFWENFLKQKLKNTPNLVGTGQVRFGLRPHPGVRLEVQVQGGLLQTWSLGCLG